MIWFGGTILGVSNSDSGGYGRKWASWLREALDGRPQKWVVDRSEGMIGSPRMSAWMQGQRPDPEGAALVADIFGEDRAVLLSLVGYEGLVPRGYVEEPAPVDPLEGEIERLPVSRRAKRLLRERREASMREFRELMAVVCEAERGQPPAEPDLADPGEGDQGRG